MNIMQFDNDCTGCAACVNICPRNCIVMQPSIEGFLYPIVNEKRCVQCGMCKSICPVQSTFVSERKERTEPTCYAAWANDSKVRFSSSSGGVFTYLAEAILGEGGAVAGVRFGKNYLTEHTLITDFAGLEALKKSKYVQSEIGFVYRQVKKALQSRLVLFTGTPCQCAGLKGYLGNDLPENLYICDMICHGVVSPMVFLQYLNEMEEKYNSAVSTICFRDKTYDFSKPEKKWRGLWMHIQFENGREYFADDKTDPFFRLFLNNICLRPSCYRCKFKGIYRPVDITISDFWGAKKAFPGLDMDVKRGVSAVFIHSKKGKKLWNIVCPSLTAYKSSIKDVVQKNTSCLQSAEYNSCRELFFKELLTKSFRVTAESLQLTLSEQI